MTDHRWTTTSRHATSEGTVVYDTCHCGVLRVRLVPGALVLAEVASSSQRFRTLRGAQQVCEDGGQAPAA